MKKKSLDCHNNRFKQCCCSCKHQVEIKPIGIGKMQNQWACVLPLTDNQRFCYSSDDEHSVGCECYTNPKTKTKG